MDTKTRDKKIEGIYDLVDYAKKSRKYTKPTRMSMLYQLELIALLKGYFEDYLWEVFFKEFFE